MNLTTIPSPAAGSAPPSPLPHLVLLFFIGLPLLLIVTLLFFIRRNRCAASFVDFADITEKQSECTVREHKSWLRKPLSELNMLFKPVTLPSPVQAQSRNPPSFFKLLTMTVSHLKVSKANAFEDSFQSLYWVLTRQLAELRRQAFATTPDLPTPAATPRQRVKCLCALEVVLQSHKLLPWASTRALLVLLKAGLGAMGTFDVMAEVIDDAINEVFTVNTQGPRKHAFTGWLRHLSLPTPLPAPLPIPYPPQVVTRHQSIPLACTSSFTPNPELVTTFLYYERNPYLRTSYNSTPVFRLPDLISPESPDCLSDAYDYTQRVTESILVEMVAIALRRARDGEYADTGAGGREEALAIIEGRESLHRRALRATVADMDYARAVRRKVKRMRGQAVEDLEVDPSINEVSEGDIQSTLDPPTPKDVTFSRAQRSSVKSSNPAITLVSSDEDDIPKDPKVRRMQALFEAQMEVLLHGARDEDDETESDDNSVETDAEAHLTNDDGFVDDEARRMQRIFEAQLAAELSQYDQDEDQDD